MQQPDPQTPQSQTGKGTAAQSVLIGALWGLAGGLVAYFGIRWLSGGMDMSNFRNVIGLVAVGSGLAGGVLAHKRAQKKTGPPKP